MSEFSLRDGGNLLRKGITNYLHHKPLIVSYEVTLSCNCNCRHCDLGGSAPGRSASTRGLCQADRHVPPPQVQISEESRCYVRTSWTTSALSSMLTSPRTS
jgi:hypothetical protein